MHWLRNCMCIPHVLLDTLTLLFLTSLPEQMPDFSFSPGREEMCPPHSYTEKLSNSSTAWVKVKTAFPSIVLPRFPRQTTQDPHARPAAATPGCSAIRKRVPDMSQHCISPGTHLPKVTVGRGLRGNGRLYLLMEAILGRNV